MAEPAVEADTARPVYPFSAIIGQEEMKFAAIMNIIDPNIGGIMVMGDRGTGKSTTVRALVDLLPLIDIVKDDAFMSSPTDPNLMAPEVLAKYVFKLGDFPRIVTGNHQPWALSLTHVYPCRQSCTFILCS